MNYEKKEPKTTGDLISGIDNEIGEIEKLVSLLTIDPKNVISSVDGNPARLYGEGDRLRNEMVEGLVEKLQNLRDRRQEICQKEPAPENILCPHCGYDGELNSEHPKHDGFRTLEPVLSPRLIMEYGDQKMVLSDPDESFDQFDNIATPSYFGPSDEESSKDYQEFRKFMRGNWLICCGKCQSYFSIKSWINRISFEYNGGSPYTSKWRRH